MQYNVMHKVKRTLED